MEKLIANIIEILNSGKNVNEDKLASLVRASNKGKTDNSKHNAKKYLMPYYLENKRNNTQIWKDWNIEPEIEKKLLEVLKVKPKRSASGVATITVITKPWKCGGNCIFCPNDIRMPKSYLSDEPACQRAERNFFDPYLQVSARLRALDEMGHATDKVEIIVLGGTFNDYDPHYQRWFISEIFRALNNGVLKATDKSIVEREQQYLSAGITNDLNKLKSNANKIQNEINSHKISYNDAFDEFYNPNKSETGASWAEISKIQTACWEDVYKQHDINTDSKHRCVGLVVETRPAVINEQTLTDMRKLGCTKVQIGVQSLNTKNLESCDRHYEEDTVAKAFTQLRKFGFKIHAHFMANLPLSNPEQDKKDYRLLVSDSRYLPDEIKLYPCMLVESARLNTWARSNKWSAYDEDTLIEVLADDIVATPQYTRISRMMRDISSKDITQGVKKTNLRQMVEMQAEKLAAQKNLEIQEIRHREIALNSTKPQDHKLDTFCYETSSTTEYFLQYVTSQNKILGFLRLSLPHDSDIAMIREVHVYGKVANVGEEATNAQHMGLGTKLIKHACQIASDKYKKINVISAIGTRRYYQARGFKHMSSDCLYQQMDL